MLPLAEPEMQNVGEPISFWGIISYILGHMSDSMAVWHQLIDLLYDLRLQSVPSQHIPP